jgi:hypothetical protein
LDMENDAVAVQRAYLGQGFENQEIQTPLKVIPCHALYPYTSQHHTMLDLEAKGCQLSLCP